ncbi:MAG: TetR family transcriptional regulator C-terminal domain-containing protein [Vampirovibrionales bacterium]
MSRRPVYYFAMVSKSSTLKVVKSLKRQETRQHLIETGLAMILAHGFNAVSVDKLVKAAGVPKGSFYHYFDSKEHFGLQVVAFFQQEKQAVFEAALNQPEGTPYTRLAALFKASHDRFANEEEFCGGCLVGNLAQEQASEYPAFQQALKTCYDAWFSLVQGVFQSAVDSGELPKTTQTQRLTQALFIAMEGALLTAKLTQSREPLDTAWWLFFDEASPLRVDATVLKGHGGAV